MKQVIEGARSDSEMNKNENKNAGGKACSAVHLDMVSIDFRLLNSRHFLIKMATASDVKQQKFFSSVCCLRMHTVIDCDPLQKIYVLPLVIFLSKVTCLEVNPSSVTLNFNSVRPPTPSVL